MSANEDSKFMTCLWKNLKRALMSTPDIQNGATICNECDNIQDGNNASNFSNNSGMEPVGIADCHMEKNIKRQRLNLAIDQVGIPEQNSFMEIMKNLLSCSICLEVNNYSNQCPNGHLICITCSGRLQQSSGDLNCPVCRVSLKQGLHRSLLAEQLTSELPATCRHCDSVMPVKHVKKHETDECPKRIVYCEYKLFGCPWTGIDENLGDHVEECSISSETVGCLHDIVSENITKDFNLLKVPLQLWKSIVSKIRTQAVGSRILIRQTALNKTVGDDVFQFVFKSPVIRVPFSCCTMHGFYLEINISQNNETKEEKLFYTLKSENRTKIFLNYFLASIKVDESINLDVQDSLHCHQFESTHKESIVHEIKITSLDCDKVIPKLSEFESFFVELCIISERERSERGHGILNSNEEDETNGFVSTSGSDSNVVFTLFSPTTNTSRSMNTSNTVVTNIDDNNLMNDVEPSHDDDIVITVSDNVDSGDEISIENREHYTSRNNHSYVSVPNVIFNPTGSVFTYSPFQLDNTFINSNFQTTARLAREPQYFELDNHQVITEQEAIRLQSNNLNRVPRPSEPMLSQDNRTILEPIHMSLFYPAQTMVSPYITNSVSPIAVRQTVDPVNVILRPAPNANQLSTRQSRPVNAEDQDHVSQNLQGLIRENSVAEVTQENQNTEMLLLPVSNPNYNFSYPHLSQESIFLEDSILQDDDE